ncbi:midkine-B-like [Scleropages formosus]|uniref:Midkine n=1 Tax=Scleropages formosus TaxID=113540 RepID=A0A8C9SF24_SCLFO|nr:midkine-B-like [Scleropages formosus]
MRGVYSLVIILLLALVMVSSEAAKPKKEKTEKGKGAKGGSTECMDWQYGKCVPSNGDCGVGIREATCSGQVKKLKCKVPCNWKKDIGPDCKYKFGNWGECDTATGTMNRSGTLKKALYNAECQTTVKVSKPCAPKIKSKTKAKGKRGKGREN